MKRLRFISGAALCLVAGAAFAQSVTFHAGVDFTTYGVTQDFRDTNGDKKRSEPSAGYDPDGSMTVDASVTAANFEFNLGLYFNADGGNQDYIDFSDGTRTPFYQGNMKVGFLNDQLSLYTGKFEDFNAGYIAGGAVLGDQSITNLADSDYGPYLTGVEIAPYAVKGLRAFVGFPILPVRGNEIPSGAAYNQWKNMIQKFKLAAQYKLPVEGLDATVNAGFRLGTYYDGVEWAGTKGGVAEHTADFTKSAFGEGYVQAVLPGLLDVVDLTVSYDIRWRNASYMSVAGKDVEKVALSHMVGVSGALSLLDDALALGVEDRFYFAGDDYIHSDEKLIYDILAVSAEYSIPGKPFACGLDLAGIFAADANGTGFDAEGNDGTAKVNNSAYAFDGSVTLGPDDMTTAATGNLEGASTTYLGCYASPYFKVKFSNGALKVGAELSYTYFFNKNVANSAFSYRVPVGLQFAF